MPMVGTLFKSHVVLPSENIMDDIMGCYIWPAKFDQHFCNSVSNYLPEVIMQLQPVFLEHVRGVFFGYILLKKVMVYKVREIHKDR